MRHAPQPARQRSGQPAALALAVVAGAASAVQSATNAELGERVGSALVGAAVNNVGGSLVLLLGLLVLPSMRSGLVALRVTRLPWWSYLGGLCGAGFVVVAAYVVPGIGVALFTIAQVTGNSLGGLAVDRSGLGPLGRIAVTGPRLAGALLGVGAVALSQLGRPVGELAVGLVLLSVAVGVAVAVQAALNGRVCAVSGTACGAAVNFAVGTPALLAVAAAAGAFSGLTVEDWPTDWYLYAGGLFGVFIVLVLMISVSAVGVLRTGLAMVAGQLGGALLLDSLLPGGAGTSVPVLAGALLTFVAVAVSGYRGRRNGRAPAVVAAADGRLVR